MRVYLQLNAYCIRSVVVLSSLNGLDIQKKMNLCESARLCHTENMSMLLDELLTPVGYLFLCLLLVQLGKGNHLDADTCF